MKTANPVLESPVPILPIVRLVSITGTPHKSDRDPYFYFHLVKAEVTPSLSDPRFGHHLFRTS